VADLRTALALAVMALMPASVAAQAWAAPAGTGSVGISTQAIWNTGHIATDGTKFPVGRSENAGVYAFGDYAITDRISIAGGLPYVFAKYVSTDAAVGDRPVDQCRCWQQAWQDVGLTARVNVLNGAFGLTPSVSIGVPSHAYEYRGEAVVGRRLKELTFAVDAGTRVDAVSEHLSISGRYAYAWVERPVDVPNNRSNLNVDGTFAFSRRLSVTGSALWQRTHGGLRTLNNPPPPPFPWGEVTEGVLFDEHDRLLRDNYFRAGVTVSRSWSEFDAFVSYVHYISGGDTHAGRALSGGVSIPFEIARR